MFLSPKIQLNIVLVLFIMANLINMIFPKGMGYGEQAGFAYQLSKFVYGLSIILMMPSLLSSKRYYFETMRYMAFYVIIHIIFAVVLDFKFDMGSILKTLMICISFVFFEEKLAVVKLNKYLLIAFMLSVLINVSYLVLTQNRLGSAIENDGRIGGGQGIANSLIYLLPLLFMKFEGKWASYLYVFGFIVVLVSLRRTSILAYLFCIPFVYRHLKRNISKKYIVVAVAILSVIVWYIVTRYWYVIEMRFSDTFEASDSGYYGSGRTGWWMVLVHNLFQSPQHWLQGFGLGQVAQHMAKAGFPFGSAHNDYLEVGYTYGIIGLILWYGTMWKLYALSNKKEHVQHARIIRMAVLSYLLIAFFSGATHNVLFVCIAVFAGLVLNNRDWKRKIILKYVKL